MKKWVFFDMMGVIFKVGDDTQDLLVPFVRKINGNIGQDHITKIYMEASLGRISSKEFWQRAGVQGDHEIVEREYLDGHLTIDEQIIPVLLALSREYNVGLLSNDVSEWSRFLRKKYGLDAFLKECVVSGDVHCRKPSQEIYEIALQKAGIPPRDCAFIDDRWKNIFPAQNLGMKVIKFNREDDFDEMSEIPQASQLSDIPKILEEIFAE